jgi:hypothetical protein
MNAHLLQKLPKYEHVVKCLLFTWARQFFFVLFVCVACATSTSAFVSLQK